MPGRSSQNHRTERNKTVQTIPNQPAKHVAPMKGPAKLNSSGKKKGSK